jgi:hypothetical protein
LSQLGAAMGTLDILIPLAILLTMALSYFYQKMWKDPIPKSYSKEDKEAIIEELAVSLLLTRDHVNLVNGNTRYNRKRVIHHPSAGVQGMKDDCFAYEQVYDTENPKLPPSSSPTKLEKNSASVVQFSDNPLITSSQLKTHTPSHILYQFIEALARDEEFHNNRYKLEDVLNGLQIEGNDELLVECRQVLLTSTFSMEVNNLRRELKKIKSQKKLLPSTGSQRFSSRTTTSSPPSSPVPPVISDEPHIIVLNTFDNLSSFKLSQYSYFKTEEGILYELNRLIHIFQVTSQDLSSVSEGTIGAVDDEKINKLFQSTYFLTLINDDFIQIENKPLSVTQASSSVSKSSLPAVAVPSATSPSKTPFMQQFLPKLYELLLSHILLHLDYYSGKSSEDDDGNGDTLIEDNGEQKNDENIENGNGNDENKKKNQLKLNKILNFENYSIQNEIVYKVGTKTFWSLEDINSLRNKFE